MRVLPRKFLFSSRSRCHRRSAHGSSPDLLEQQDAQHASPFQCPGPDATGGSTLNGDVKVEVEHVGSTDDCNSGEKRLDAGNAEHNRNFGGSEAEDTSSSDEAVQDEDDTSENGSAADERTMESVVDEGGRAIDGMWESRRVEDVRDEETTAIHGIDEKNGTPSNDVEVEQKATRDRVGVENGPSGDATDMNRGVAESSTTLEEYGQLRPRDPIRSSFRKLSDSGPQVTKKVTWMEKLAEVHEYETSNPRELLDDVPTFTKCVCIIL